MTDIAVAASAQSPDAAPTHPAAQDPAAGPARLARLAGLLPSAAVGLLMIWTSSIVTPGGRVFTLVDDALISMSYARTLAQTGELVWFPGAPRVEGITNPLWALFMTIPQALGLSASASCLVVSLAGLACVLGTAYVAGGLALRLLATAGRGGRTVAAGLTTAAVGLLWPLLFWSVFGLEVGLVSLLTVAAAALALRSLARGLSPGSLLPVGVVLALGVLTRPDFAVVAGAVGLWALALPERLVPGAPARWRRAAAVWAPPLLAALALTAARWAYYGALLPNTYTLKMGGSTSLERISRAWSVHHEFVLWGALAAVAVWLLWRHAATAQRLAVLLVAGSAALLAGNALYSGGDAFRPDRFTVAPLVLLTVLIVAAAVRLGGRRTVAGLVAGAAGCALAVGLSSATSYRDWAASGSALPSYDAVAYLGSRETAGYTSADAVIAVYGAGAPVYWGERPAIDILGKVDPVVAAEPRKRATPLPGHDKWDYTHSIVEARPDVVSADLLSPDSAESRLFPPTADERAQLATAYDRYCVSGTAILVRKDTTAVDRSKIAACPLG